METILGIDLGTTNSEVSIIRDNNIIVIEKDGRKILPSVVGIDPAGNLLVGHPAKNQAVLYPERTIKSIKRRMGEDIKVKLGDREYTPPEISAMILRTLRSYAEEYLSQQITKAVITVPAFFNDNQRAATRLAGELAGLEVVRIINEPTAASLVYGADREKSETLLVYDLGGGTFDVSILRVENDVIEVLASHGDTHLGGDDFDQRLFDYVCDGFKKKNKIDLREIPVAANRVLQAVENVKKQLSTEPYASIKEEFIADKNGNPLHLDMEISREHYEEMILPLLEKTIICLNDALRDAKLHPSDIDEIILVGGASRTPLVHQLLEKRMNTALHGEIDPDLCVTMGAAAQGGLISGANVGRVLIDITPHTLGVRTIDKETHDYYLFSPLIKRNTPIPCSRSEVYMTSCDNQERVEVEVFQGENDDTRHNAMIGNFSLTGLSKVPEGNEIICRFDLDISGMLHVSAMEKITGLKNAITVKNALINVQTNEHVGFKEHLNQFFANQEFGPILEEEEEDDDEVALSEIENFDGGRPPEGWETTYANEVAIFRKAVVVSPKVSEKDAIEIGKLMKKITDAIQKDKRDDAASYASELEDLLYYLEDSV
jgi:molecular chaperone DnaK